MKKLVQILKNPFAVIDEKKLLFLGIFSFIVGIFLSYIFQMQIQILRIKTLETLNIKQITIGLFIVVIALTIVFYIFGKIINNKTRFIDILNMGIIALIPLYISLFQNLNNFSSNEITKMINALKEGNIHTQPPSLLFILVALIGLCFIIYYIYLLFIGFKTATNAKKIGHYIIFFILLFITDILTSGLINSI